MDWTLAQTECLNLEGIKRLAYTMPPMERLSEEGACRGDEVGGMLDMSAMRAKRAKKPLAAIRRASARVNRECRGTKQEYASVILSEYATLAGARKKANEWLQ